MGDNTKRGFFSPYSQADPSMNVPVTAGPAGKIISPYMNFDPSYIQTGGDSQFIYPEGANRNRGRLEMSFSQIGGSIFVGAALGGTSGLVTGLKDPNLANQALHIKRTQMLNYISKRGASTAQSFGVIALMYSLFGVAFWWLRGYEEDNINTFAAAGATGLLYRSSAGWKGCLKGGAAGLGLASLYYLIVNKDKLRQSLTE